MPGAKLCADCRAARKRAFAATVTQPLLEAVGARRSRSSSRLLRPSQSIAATARRAARDAKAAETSPLVDTPSVRRGLFPSILIAVVLVLGVGAYSAQRMKAAGVAESPPDAAGSLAGAPPIAAPVVPAAVAPGAPSPAVTRAQETTSTESGAPAPETPAPAAKKQVAHPRVAPASTVIALPAPDAPAAVVVPAPPAPAPPPPKPVAQADPWQQLNEGLSACAREDWGSRLRCEQRIRVRYCEGQWGVAPQCPIGPNTDHGQ